MMMMMTADDSGRGSPRMCSAVPGALGFRFILIPLFVFKFALDNWLMRDNAPSLLNLLTYTRAGFDATCVASLLATCVWIGVRENGSRSLAIPIVTSITRSYEFSHCFL